MNRNNSENSNSDGRSILCVTGLDGPGENIIGRDLFYIFNLNARTKEDDLDKIENVVNIRFGRGFAVVKMLNVDAACRAKAALNESWIFDKFVKVNWATTQECALLESNKPSLASVYRRRYKDFIERRQRQRDSSRRRGDNYNQNGNSETQDEDDIQVQIASYLTKMPSLRTRFLQPGNGPTEEINLNFAKMQQNSSPLKRQTNQEQQGTSRSASIASRLQNDFQQQHSAHSFAAFSSSLGTRTVTRTRPEPSPVLYVLGLEYLEDPKQTMLTRGDLAILFSFCGKVIDIEIGLRKKDNIVEKYYAPCKHQALIAMETVEQATMAINEYDHSWQMGRFINVTYSYNHSIARPTIQNRPQGVGSGRRVFTRSAASRQQMGNDSTHTETHHHN